MNGYIIKDSYIINDSYRMALKCINNIKQVVMNKGRLYILDNNGFLTICDFLLRIMARCRRNYFDKILFTDRMYYGGNWPTYYGNSVILRSRHYQTVIHNAYCHDMCVYGKSIVMALNTKVVMASVKLWKINDKGIRYCDHPYINIKGVFRLMTHDQYLYAFTPQQCHIIDASFNVIDTVDYNNVMLDHYSGMYFKPDVNAMSYDRKTLTKSNHYNPFPIVLRINKHYHDIVIVARVQWDL